jgi:hypothetical protein
MLLSFRGNSLGVLIVGDSLPANKNTVNNIGSVLDPRHPVYNSLIIPIKYYLNNYLNSCGFQLPLDKQNDDFFYYINAVENPLTKKNPDLSNLGMELKKQEHKIILCMGNFAFWAVEQVFDRKTRRDNSIAKLGEIFTLRINENNLKFPIILPILHNIANLKFEKCIEYIPDIARENYISYFHYVGVQLGQLILRHIKDFQFVTKTKEINK